MQTKLTSNVSGRNSNNLTPDGSRFLDGVLVDPVWIHVIMPGTHQFGSVEPLIMSSCEGHCLQSWDTQALHLDYGAVRRLLERNLPRAVYESTSSGHTGESP